MVRSPTIGIRFTDEDLALLDTLAEREERNRSDIVRRAIRAYAEALGITAKKKARPKKK